MGDMKTAIDYVSKIIAAKNAAYVRFFLYGAMEKLQTKKEFAGANAVYTELYCLSLEDPAIDPSNISGDAKSAMGDGQRFIAEFENKIPWEFVCFMLGRLRGALSPVKKK